MNENRDADLVKTGISTVLAGARLALAARGAIVVAHKGECRDIVTQADLDISALMCRQFGDRGWTVVSEEAPLPVGLPEAFWVIDPIDGTVNFSHGLPHFAVSAGWVEGEQFYLGVVCAPALDELYFTLNPSRVLLNGKPFFHEHRGWEEALVAASFAVQAGGAQYALFQQVNESTRGCLRTGSAALNVCWAASGKLQAAYGFGAKLWDVAGALAVARAAGCDVRLRREPGALTLDYCVGSRDVVGGVLRLAESHGLWER